MNKTLKMMMELIKCETLGVPLNDSYKIPLSDKEINALYEISKAHDLCHVVGSAMIKYGLIEAESPIFEKFNNQILKAVSRYERINHELISICDALENAKIPFIPLKGSVLRAYYPEPWLRTSCDIDIYVQAERLKDTIKTLENELGFKAEGAWINDVSLYSPSGVHLEIHYSDNDNKQTEVFVLKSVWENSVPKDGKKYQTLMSNEYFYLYHIAHMVKHFVSGGCGIRPFIDSVLIQERMPIDWDKFNNLLEKFGYNKFKEGCDKLIRVWFGDLEHDEDTLRMQHYLLKAGVYGDRENWINMQKTKQGSTKKHVLSRIFISFEELRAKYPQLGNRRWLAPIYQVRRWFRVFRPSVYKRSMNEVKMTSSVSEETKREVMTMLNKLGLDE